MLNKRQWLVIAIAYTIFVFFASLLPIKGDVGPQLLHKDKIVHVAIYIIFTIVWFAYFYNSSKKNNYIKAIALSFCTGVLVEFLQETLTLSRSADIYDIIANCLGIIIAILCIKHFKFNLKCLIHR